MRNRVASLFDLDELLGSNGNGNGNGHAPAPRPRRRKKTAASHTPGSAYRGHRHGKHKVHSDRHVDKGDPIRCEHNVPYKPVTPVDVKEPPVAPPPNVPPPAAQQLGEDDYNVEAFEEPDEDDSLRLLSEDEEELELDYPKVEDAFEQSFHPSEPLPDAELDESYRPRTFAAQMEAVEKDLADLAARVPPPAQETAGEDASSAEEEVQNTPSPAPQSGHAVFDQMAQGMGMGYATEFRLPAVQLSQVFSALDRQLDAEERQKTASIQTPVVSGAPAPVAPPDSATLLKDLVRMPVAPPEQKAGATPSLVPIPATPTKADPATPAPVCPPVGVAPTVEHRPNEANTPAPGTTA